MLRRVPGPVAFLAAVALVASRPATAAEISVSADATGDFPTIQAAIDAALPGDHVVLEDGTFTGAGNRDLTFDGKDLVVRSRNGPGAAAIDSQGSPGDPHRAFRLDAGETSASRIEGLTITGGFVEGPFPESGGGGILVAYDSHPVIENCVFDGNEAGFQGFGAGLLAWEGCDITLRDCSFLNGTSGWYGGGFTLRKDCDALVERCQVIGNWALHAGGGASITNSDATVNDCLFADNETVEVDGGGVLVKAGALPVFTRCVFSGNRAFWGGGLGVGNYADVTAIDCLFENNEAMSSGGAVIVSQDPASLHAIRCTFVHNRATYHAGHILAAGSSTITVESSILGAYCDASTAMQASHTGSLEISCSVVPGGEPELTGVGTRIWGEGNVDADPLFCGSDPDSCDAGPLPNGDYTIDSMSPASASWNPCGRVGAYDVGCGVTGAPELDVEPWGRIKARFRGRYFAPGGERFPATVQ
ncbi:MAG TPA: right-handed parallel beta-helix repeat-containing protein [bacterium]|nr:right-handed parallel beta-helix repeat-containing protein [bacterium]